MRTASQLQMKFFYATACGFNLTYRLDVEPMNSDDGAHNGGSLSLSKRCHPTVELLPHHHHLEFNPQFWINPLMPELSTTPPDSRLSAPIHQIKHRASGLIPPLPLPCPALAPPPLFLPSPASLRRRRRCGAVSPAQILKNSRALHVK